MVKPRNGRNQPAQISLEAGPVPGRRGYPAYMYSDLASLYERAGRLHGRPGAVTQIPSLWMPDDDVTHPIRKITGYITDGPIVLSRELERRGLTPPIDVLASLSRLMNAGIGAGCTREDHRGVADAISAFLGRGGELRRLTSIVGEQALSDDDRRTLGFVDDFERRFVGQDVERRSLEQTLDLGWDLLARYPGSELERIEPQLVERYHITRRPSRDDGGNARHPKLGRASGFRMPMARSDGSAVGIACIFEPM